MCLLGTLFPMQPDSQQADLKEKAAVEGAKEGEAESEEKKGQTDILF